MAMTCFKSVSCANFGHAMKLVLPAFAIFLLKISLQIFLLGLFLLYYESPLKLNFSAGLKGTGRSTHKYSVSSLVLKKPFSIKNDFFGSEKPSDSIVKRGCVFSACGAK